MQRNRKTRPDLTSNAVVHFLDHATHSLIVGLVLVVCAGCSDGRCPISGKVTFNSLPVQEGVISLEPADGKGPVVGGKIVAGAYAMTGRAAPLPGKKLVRISAARKTGRRIPAGPPLPRGTMTDEIDRYIPDTYNTRSTLTCDVSPDGARQIDFDLKSP